MDEQQGDYEYYTRHEDNRSKYVLLAIVAVAVAGAIIWMISKNRDLSAAYHSAIGS